MSDNPTQHAEYVRDLVAEAVPGSASCDCSGGPPSPCNYCLFVAEEIIDYLVAHGYEIAKRRTRIDGEADA